MGEIITQSAVSCVQSLRLLLHGVSVEVGEVREQVGFCTKKKMKLFVAALLCLGVIGVHSDSHTLRYYYTAVSNKGSGLPEFSAVGYVDDREFENYNSETQKTVPKAQWVERNEVPEYWDRHTQIFKGTEPTFRRNVKTAMSRFNQTAGIHIYQVMYGCRLRDDGTTEGYYQHGYDGGELLSLDTQRWIFIATMNEALISTQRWNSPEVREGERWKNYLENECIEWLKKYIEYGREDLERRVRPEVKVWGHDQQDGITRLQCLVYGFHPRPVDVKWMRNGTDHIPSDENNPTLPHPDGTYQIRVSVEVPTKEAGTYVCHVVHSSLDDDLTKKYEPDIGTKFTMIIGIVCALAFIAVAVAVGVGIYCYKKKGKGYKTTSTSDASSDSSNPKV